MLKNFKNYKLNKKKSIKILKYDIDLGYYLVSNYDKQ